MALLWTDVLLSPCLELATNFLADSRYALAIVILVVAFLNFAKTALVEPANPAKELLLSPCDRIASSKVKVGDDSESATWWFRFSDFCGCGPNARKAFGIAAGGTIADQGSELNVHLLEGKPWLRGGQRTVHPKYCFLRWRWSSGTLACNPFEAEMRFDPKWEVHLRCSEPERHALYAFRSAIKAVDGAKDAVTLIRFLRARNLDIEQAVKMYVVSMKWRVEAELWRGFRDFSIDDTLHRRLDDYYRCFGFLGRDDEGDPVLYERMGLVCMMSLARLPTEFLVRHEVYHSVRLMQAMEELTFREGRPIVSVTAIIDLQNIHLGQLNLAALRKLKECVTIAEANFPEILKRVIVINAPWIFDQFWSVARQLVCDGTRKKFQVVAAKNVVETLGSIMDVTSIPACYGGKLWVGGAPHCEPILPRPKGPIPESLIKDIVAACEG